jgi:hypothetical protein
MATPRSGRPSGPCEPKFPAAPLLKLTPPDAAIPVQWLRRARRDGTVGLMTADRWSLALGLHPVEVFGDLWLTQLRPA